MLKETQTAVQSMISTVSKNGSEMTKSVLVNANEAQKGYSVEVNKMPVIAKEGMTATASAIVSAKPSFSQGGHEVGIEDKRGADKGIEDGKSSVLNAIASWASSILQSAIDALGIKSPSTLFAELGDYSAQGFANGLISGINKIDVSSIMSNIVPKLSLPLNNNGSGQIASYDQSSTINISGVNINEEVDLNLFGQYLAATIQNRIY